MYVSGWEYETIAIKNSSPVRAWGTFLYTVLIIYRSPTSNRTEMSQFSSNEWSKKG